MTCEIVGEITKFTEPTDFTNGATKKTEFNGAVTLSSRPLRPANGRPVEVTSGHGYKQPDTHLGCL